MGIKLLNLQIIKPWCFYIPSAGKENINEFQKPTKSSSSSGSGSGSASTRIIKLIKPDGVVVIYERPIPVAELIREFPMHLVCHSDSFYIGQKIPPLAEHDLLQAGHNYFLLPKHFFQSALSFLTIASFAASASDCCSSSSNNKTAAGFLKKAASSSCQPFHIQKTPSGCLRIRVSEEFISQLMLENNGNVSDTGEESRGVCTTPQLHKDYTQLVTSRPRHWKPKLETISEAEDDDDHDEDKPLKNKKKGKLSSFGRKTTKRKKNKSSTAAGKPPGGGQRTRRSERYHHQHASSSTSLLCIKPPQTTCQYDDIVR